MIKTKKRKQSYYSSNGDGFWNEFGQYFEEPSGLYQKLKREEKDFAKYLQENTSITNIRVALEPEQVNQLFSDAKILAFTARNYNLLGAKQTSDEYLRKATNVLEYAAERSRYDCDVVRRVAEAMMDAFEKRRIEIKIKK